MDRIIVIVIVIADLWGIVRKGVIVGVKSQRVDRQRLYDWEGNKEKIILSWVVVAVCDNVHVVSEDEADDIHYMIPIMVSGLSLKNLN